MLKLHGVPRSNYYNMVKTAMLEKGLDFEEVLARPSQETGFLSRSAMGKVPCLETDAGSVAETPAILDFLEEAYPAHPLLPTDPFERAKVRELVQTLNLYVELVARRGFGLLFGAPVTDEVKAQMKEDLPRGVAAVGRLVRFSPWIAGETFTYADLVAYFVLVYAARSAQGNIGLDMYQEIPGLRSWFDRVGERDSVKKALADGQ